MTAAGCSNKSDDGAPAASITPTNLTLTPDQRKHVRLATVARSAYQRTIDATGSVDFNNEQATAVLAPISGPVSQLLVDIGDRVKKGDPLALVDSPDFAAAISAYRKALTTAHTAHRLADLEKDLVEHQGIARREEDQAQADAANADADVDAALKTLVSLNVDPKIIKAVEQGSRSRTSAASSDRRSRAPWWIGRSRQASCFRRVLHRPLRSRICPTYG